MSRRKEKLWTLEAIFIKEDEKLIGLIQAHGLKNGKKSQAA